MIFKRGTLWDSIVKTAEHALTIGALQPFATDYTFIEDAGIRFFVRILSSLTHKDEAKKRQEAELKAGRNANPFFQPEKELTVADISKTHLAVLNKFNVVKHHLLIITRAFEGQDMLLNQKDFEALWLCMAEFDALGFYNGGREAGASQQHKHLQMVPLPLAPSGPLIPIEPLLAAAPVKKIGTVPGFPFLHSFAPFERELANSPLEAAKKAYELYTAMLANVGMTPPKASGQTRQSMPYCFLATRDWMLLVPRTREFFEDISLNSLAYAGSLFVRNEQQLETIKKLGPLKALASVAMPKGG